ncbi:LOG family protein [Woodsholea maritima]|uniref:LOG family protein n=1 Tax=Woodsholea maritima TaxID=240237 RepID=UPI00036B7898|nr:TIGR00730 family Rossman fold protein [Woodsholea maritima]
MKDQIEMTAKTNICVYCGSRTGINAAYTQLAKNVGAGLVRAGRTLVYGGGQVGLMGVLADAVIDAGGDVIGVIPDFLAHKEVAHPRVKTMHIVESMHVRKAMMADHADAFIALPGGIGTMEELFEIWTWTQLGRHKKPVGVLNTNGYFDGLLTFLDRMRDEDFLSAEHRAMLMVDDDLDRLLARFDAYEAPEMDVRIKVAKL